MLFLSVVNLILSFLLVGYMAEKCACLMILAYLFLTTEQSEVRAVTSWYVMWAHMTSFETLCWRDHSYGFLISCFITYKFKWNWIIAVPETWHISLDLEVRTSKYGKFISLSLKSRDWCTLLMVQLWDL
jgi:hypothetical protein